MPWLRHRPILLILPLLYVQQFLLGCLLMQRMCMMFLQCLLHLLQRLHAEYQLRPSLPVLLFLPLTVLLPRPKHLNVLIHFRRMQQLPLF